LLTWIHSIKQFMQDHVLGLFFKRPKNTDQLITFLRHCTTYHLLDAHSLRMMEGVLKIATMQIRDAMVPRAQMICLSLTQTPMECIKIIQESKHSRYPVLGEDRDDIVGILLAKDLLSILNSQQTTDHPIENIESLCHPPMFTAESKRMDELLRDFQLQHQHMAIVADEYGGVAGLVTIEDIMEEIVGDIEDEFYTEDSTISIRQEGHTYIIQGQTKITEINQKLDAQIDDTHFDTIAGLVAQKFGYIPTQGEQVQIDRWTCKVLNADERCIKLLSIQLFNPHN